MIRSLGGEGVTTRPGGHTGCSKPVSRNAVIPITWGQLASAVIADRHAPVGSDALPPSSEARRLFP